MINQDTNNAWQRCRAGLKKGKSAPPCHGAGVRWQCRPWRAQPERGLSRRRRPGGGSLHNAGPTAAAWAGSALELEPRLLLNMTHLDSCVGLYNIIEPV